GKVWSVALSPDGKSATVSTWQDRKRFVTDLATGMKKVYDLPGKDWWVLAFSSDGEILVTGHYNPPVIRVWQVATGKELRQMQGHRGQPERLALSPDAKTLASVSSNALGADDTIRFWDFATGKELRRIPIAPRSVWSVTFSPDSKSLVSVGRTW